MATFEPDKAATIPDWIRAGSSLVLSRDKLMMKVKEQGVVYPYQSLTTRFGGLFNKYIVDYEFDMEVWPDYAFNPKRFCKDYYGTPELWGDILFINHMTSATEFNKRHIKIYSDSIIGAIAELKALYKDDLEENRLEVEG